MPSGLGEAALAHSRGAVADSYLRTTTRGRRCPWMEARADFLDGKAAATAIELQVW
jgi:hypothetical protein